MIALLLSWMLTLCVALAIGTWVTDMEARYSVQRRAYGLLDIFFIGICMVVAFLQFWSLVLPVNYWALISLCSVSLLYWCIHLDQAKSISSRFWKLLWAHKVTGGIALLLCCGISLYALLPPLLYDSSMYYLQAIKWNESYPVIPGLGNIHGRFGFNSSILIWSSAFSLHEIFQQYIFGINALCTFLFILWLVVRMKNGGPASVVMALLFFIYFLGQFKLSLSSPSTDVFPNILVATVLLKLGFQSDSIQSSPLTFWMLPLLCLTLKLSTAPICFVSLFMLVAMRKSLNLRCIAFLIVVLMFILIPWLLRNIILTGYLIYPFSGLDIFQVDWKIPIADVVELKNWIYSWARVSKEHYQDVLVMPITQWLPLWWAGQSAAYKVLFLESTLSLLLLPFILIQRRIRKIRIEIAVTWIVAVGGVCYWFFTAPDIRFGLSFLLVAVIVPVGILSRLLKGNSVAFIKFAYICLYFISIIFVRGGFTEVCKVNSSKPFLPLLCKPLSVSQLRECAKVSFDMHTVNNITIYTPRNGNQCFDCEIPCTPYIHEKLEMRGTRIQEGFRIRQ